MTQVELQQLGSIINNNNRTFVIEWRDKNTECISGSSFSEAFLSAGYGEVDLDLITDYYEL